MPSFNYFSIKYIILDETNNAALQTSALIAATYSVDVV